MLALEEKKDPDLSSFISQVEYTDDRPFEGFKDTGVFSNLQEEIFLCGLRIG